ncbi:STAS domain-containing protein [Paenibacillus sp. GCM10023252]|uniref:STAS domain-containing protein n=1 Tax=Paenibacillus sp. GCM10023252 TaxID=3252649 RepID=UPI0036204DB3
MTIKKFLIEVQQSEAAHILHIAGELDLAAAQEFRAALDSVVHDTSKTLILDVQELRYIDSTGIGIIVSVIKIRDEINAPLAVRNIPTGIRRLFDMTGISGFINEG